MTMSLFGIFMLLCAGALAAWCFRFALNGMRRGEFRSYFRTWTSEADPFDFKFALGMHVAIGFILVAGIIAVLATESGRRLLGL